MLDSRQGNMANLHADSICACMQDHQEDKSMRRACLLGPAGLAVAEPDLAGWATHVAALHVVCKALQADQ